ncbi:hypothetical protein RUM44_013951 [Polyplax serrata]|uniref:Uncharacterized protein n=1 Tax=Polyplax serrata TaxID=468196 RepID=A0ABR1BFL6_POLSC
MACLIGCQFQRDDYTSTGDSDWALDYSGGKLPLLMPMPTFLNSQIHVPMPTLYNGTCVEPLKTKPNLSIVELVLYNMAAMLAGVASGYDVRLSNVSPVHPTLRPDGSDDECSERRWWFRTPDSTPYASTSNRSSVLGQDYEFSSSSGYAHNTYHGPARHIRPELNSLASENPSRFLDSHQHYVPSQAMILPSGIPPPSPRRKSSSTSNEGVEMYAPTGTQERTPYIDYHGIPSERSSNDLPHRYQHSPRPEMFRKEIIDQRTQFEMMHYRQQQNLYGTNEYSYGTVPLTDIGENDGGVCSSNAFTSRFSSNVGHRRNNSSTCTNSSGNTSYRVEDDDYNYQITLQNKNYHGRSVEYSPLVSRHEVYPIARQNSSESERPVTLEVNTKLRSSMKKYSYNRGNSPKVGSNNSGSSGAGTPTNPTPPDSLTSEDSSYVSAKEGSVSRVRFSPITALMCEFNSQREGILDLGYQGDSSFSIQARRPRKPSASEFDKDFMS